MDLNPEVLNGILRLIVSLLAPVVGFLFWTYKKQLRQAEKLEQRLVGLEKALAIKQIMVLNIQEDIKEIKSGVDKLIERSYYYVRRTEDKSDK